MSEVSDYDIGRLSASVDVLTAQVQEMNERLDRLEHQLERTRGIGIGVVLATVGLSGVGGGLLSKWLTGGG